MFPNNRIFRAYILGVITGMGAACAYLAGLAWRRQRDQHQHISTAANAFLRELHEKG